MSEQWKSWDSHDWKGLVEHFKVHKITSEDLCKFANFLWHHYQFHKLKPSQVRRIIENVFSEIGQVMYEVKPLPFAFCEGCINNGCYPWNDSPALLCQELGGLFPNLYFTENGEIRSCLTFRLVDEEMWQAFLKDSKTEAESNEEIRQRAITGKTLSSVKLP